MSDYRAQQEQSQLLKNVVHELEKRAKGVFLSPPLHPMSREQRIPLSFAQQRLWFLEQLEPGKAHYNEYVALRLKGMINIDALEQSFSEIVRRHEILRTTFASADGKAFQQILPWKPQKLELVDLQEIPGEEREAHVQWMATAAVEELFDLVKGPLLRLRLFQLAEEDYLLLTIYHHIIGDGWSMAVLYHELAALYGAYSVGDASPLPELSIQYADYTLWQQQWLQGEVLQKQLDYWRQQLQDAPAQLALPTDRPRPAMQTYAGARRALLLSPELLQKLKAVSRREGVTLFMTLLATFQVLLMRYSGQSDIVVGSPIAHRTRREIESLIGFFANTLVLRTDLAGNPSFQQLLRRVQQTTLQAYAHQAMPFEKLVVELEPERALNQHPLFQVALVFQNFALPAFELPGVTWSFFELTKTTSRFDLLMELSEEGSGLLTTIEYSTDLFEASTIERFLGHWQVLLEAVVDDITQPIETLPLLTASERTQLLYEWNATRSAFSESLAWLPEETIQQLFARQARQRSEAIALVYEEQQLTYGALNRKANQLAHHLQQLGVGPDVLVGVCMGRSLELVISLLAILKAGGAYVPLDPNYPIARLTFILQDTQTGILLSQTHLLDRLPAQQTSVLCLDPSWPTIAAQPSTDPAVSLHPGSLAYVIYTSGSTGVPKGVLISHQHVTRLFASTRAQFHFDQHDHWTLFHSIAFDFSVWELWGALLHGGRLVLVPFWQSRSPESFLELLAEQQITVLNQTPSAFRLLVAATSSATRLLSLRWIIFGGEALDQTSVQLWFARYGEDAPRLVNMYGITETTVHVTCLPLNRQVMSSLQSPIGRPLSDLAVYVLDKWGQPVPIGVTGEMYVGGAGVARGYLHRPELTAQRFVPHPFIGTSHSEAGSDSACGPGARLYRSGDLARYTAEGQLEYLGRNDAQVKVRGFRIELGEIETVLAEHPSIQMAVVMLRESKPGDMRLVAYVVMKQEHTAISSELRGYLQQRLPDYMLPSAIVSLETFPLTTNGKVDYARLEPPVQEVEEEEVQRETATEMEERLMGLWCQVLGVNRVGRQKNFFALGGDSILSIQVVSRGRQQGLALTPKLMFQHQTIAELARVLEEMQGEDVIAAEQGIVQGDAHLTPIQRWFFAQQLTEPHHYNQAVLLRVRQPLDQAVLREALQQIVLHHDALRLRFLPQDDQRWRQLHAPYDSHLPVAALHTISLAHLPVIEQQAEMQTQVARLHADCDLQRGPLLRALYIDLGPQQEARLLIVIHHLMVDGVSWRILLEDLQIAYVQLAQSQPAALPAKTTSFQRWAERLHAYAQEQELQREAMFWQECLQHPVPPLPTDKQGENTVASCQTMTYQLSANETQALLSQVPQAYHTQINDALLAAFAQTLASWTGHSHVLFHLEGHGREQLFEDVDLSRTVGWFTSLYPVMLTVDGLEPLAQPGLLLSGVKEQLRAIMRQSIGYGLLRYLSQDEAVSAQMKALPQPQIVFNYLGQFDQSFSSDSLFTLVPEATGLNMSPVDRQAHLLDVNASIVNDQLQISWTYSQNLYEAETISRLAGCYQEALRALIAHCCVVPTPHYTPSDFPLVQLTQLQLSTLQEQYPDLEDLYYLSPTQEGMLFHTLYQPDAGAYITQLTWSFQGYLQPRAFERAWQLALQRHAILRTAFIWDGVSRSLQLVQRVAHLPFQVLDWRHLSCQEQQNEREALLQADRAYGFAPECAPLMRVMLVYETEQRVMLLWSHHHLLLDGWSLPLLLQDVLRCYQHLCDGDEIASSRARPYRDYINWLEQQNLDQAEHFWRRYLAGWSEPTHIQVDHTPDADADNKPVQTALVMMHLEQSITERLQGQLRQRHLTMSTLLQGAWARLLSCYSGQQEVIFGATVAGRPPQLPEVETMVGLFINTLPVRIRIEPQAQIWQWLQHIQEQQLETRQYEYTPLVKIQQWSQVQRGEALFESILVFENYPIDEAVKEQVRTLSILDVQAIEQTNYPLTLRVMSQGESLSFSAFYDQARWEQATIQRMLGHLCMLLEAISTAGEQPLAGIPLLTAQERYQMLEQWNQTSDDATARAGSLHGLFEAQVARTPDAIALVAEDAMLTYGQLNRRANQLAHYLRSLGVGPEVVVGVALERSLLLSIGLLGILKAGGAYLPLDRSYPAERLAFMVQQARVSLLLTTTELHAELALFEHITQQENGAGCRVLELDQQWRPHKANYQNVKRDQALWAQPNNNPSGEIFGEQMVYMIYTSGSTGRPKGVMNTHRGICNRLLWMQQAYNLEPTDRVLQKTPISFDVSVWELFWPLLVGAQLVMARPEGHRDPGYLVETIQQRAISTLHFVPSMLQVFVEEPHLEACQSIRRVICSGEALSLELQRTFFARLHTQLHNLYGPTEAAVDVTFWACEPGGGRASVPIGRPIANTQIYLLDAYLQPVPVRVAGELYIGGIGLARGYWGNAALTAERFVPNPFGSVPGERLYKTGDLACWNSEGAIEYLGRSDRQVKLRGLRIELGEIEACLQGHATVRACVVKMHVGAAQQKHLVGYVVPGQGESVSEEELRRYAQGKLPDYMVPTTVVILEALPVTENGKVDYARLQPPIQEVREEEELGEAATELEERLMGLWCQVLGVGRVGRQENFFALGGDSILSIQVVSRGRQQGLSLTPKLLFQHQTIAELAKVLPETQGVSVVAAEQGLAQGNVPLTPIQHWFFAHELSFPHHWNQSFRIEVLEKLNWESLERALAALLAHHDALRLRFSQQADGSWLQWYGELDTVVPLTWIDLSAILPIEREAFVTNIEEEVQRSLNLSTGPLLRVVFFQSGQHAPDYLLFIIHHLAVDGVSWRLLFEDLQVVYQQYAQRLPAQLPLKTSSYRAWTEHLVAYAQTPLLKQELPYWLALVQRFALEIPADLPCLVEENREYSARTTFSTLSVAMTQILLEEFPRLYKVQIQEAIVAALTQVYTTWTGNSMFLLDMEGHGREEIFEDVDLSRTVGWFTAIFPVCLQLEQGSAIEETLTVIKKQLSSIPGRGLGYGVLNYLCEDPAVIEALHALPRPRVLFNYLGQIDQSFSTAQVFGAAQLCYEGNRDPQGKRGHCFEIDCWVARKQLHIRWTYSENLHHRATVEQLNGDFLATLQAYAEHGELAASNRRYTAEDFSDIDLSPNQLAQILSVIHGDSGDEDEEEYN